MTNRTSAGLFRIALSAALVLWAPAPTLAQTAPASPCSAPEHRAFDFWVGEWDVFTPDGRQAGQNVITRTMGGCVLHESYDGGQGYHGESFNVYDASRGLWHQTWVDNGGLLLVIEGGVRDGAMVMEGSTVAGEGVRMLQRISWTPLSEDGSRVRQFWQQSSDGGESWTTVFDGEYRRRGR